MDNWQTVVLSSILALLSSVITVSLTLAITHRNETKKLILEERTKLYLELYSFIELLRRDQYKVYEKEYVDEIGRYAAEMSLLASNETLEAGKNFFSLVTGAYNKYCEFYDKNDPLENEVEEYYDDKLGKSVLACTAGPWAIDDFKRYEENYKKDNLLGVELFDSIESLYKAMRKDLGNSIKKR